MAPLPHGPADGVSEERASAAEDVAEGDPTPGPERAPPPDAAGAPSRYLCIHGHFYQPPRENPWLEAIERQDSAYPYHDWNERIEAECYARNTASRVLDGDGRIVRIVNNFADISFNVGPTLLAWMEEKAPDTYAAILRADRRSRDRFGGHGSALAQAYGHTILPLSNDRDRRTQVRWGIRDFERRFGRQPEGMWLPETAADVPTLEALAAEGIRFAVLAPSQAKRVRPLAPEPHAAPARTGARDRGGDGGRAPDGGRRRASGDGGSGREAGERAARPGSARAAELARPVAPARREWTDVTGARVDPTRPYLHRLPSGREIVVFFYDGPVSRAVAFEELLRDGERFASRLLGLFRADREDAQLVHIATDGETYGHHHEHGEMALSYALRRIREREDVRLTNYAEFLDFHPPEHEVEILEGTSWSCAHGVERWRGDCGCSTGGQPGWSQAWRGPLREALDELRDRVVPLYEERGAELFGDPWAARDDYVDVVLDRSPASLDRFFDRRAAGELDEDARVEALELLELQRHAMLMYTSCGWFFADLAGIETVQVLEYAARVLQLARRLFGQQGEALEAPFLERLDRARSNLPEQGTGREIYERRVRPKAVELEQVCAHHAIASLFDTGMSEGRLYGYALEPEEAEAHEVGPSRLLLGRARVTSEITRRSERFAFAALHFGDHNVQAGVRPDPGSAAFRPVREALLERFERADLAAVLRRLEAFFGHAYALGSLFRDEQGRIVDRILESTLEEVETIYRQVHERHVPLMRFVAALDLPQPRALEMAGEFVLNADLRRLLREEGPDVQRIADLLADARREAVALDARGLALALSKAVERLAAAAAGDPGAPGRLERFEAGVDLARAAPFPVNLWKVQNVFWSIVQEELPERRARAEEDPAAAAWVERISALAEKLSVALPA